MSYSLPQRLRSIRDALSTGLVERDVAVRLALIAVLAGEHLLMLGPPGTAKSLVARRLRLAFADATYFERLLTRFTVPEELFGPLSIKSLEEDVYRRLTEAYLPTSSIAFLDEIFKANSAILNALLTLLNERQFDNGSCREATPLIGVVGASNELPGEKELDALYDRFLLRLHVGPVSGDGFPALLRLRGQADPAVPSELQLTTEELLGVQEAAQAVAVPEDVEALLCDLREWCAAEEITVSDRRWRKVVKLLQVAALTNGRDTVSVWDGWLLQHCLWGDPVDRERVYEWYAERVGATANLDPSRLTRIVVLWEQRLERDREDRSIARDEDGQLLYRGPNGAPTIASVGPIQHKRGAEPLHLAPPDAWSGDHYSPRRLKDRTANGQGYTVGELDDLLVGQERQPFHAWKDRQAYLESVESWLSDEGEYEPVLEPTRHKEAHVQACLREIDDVRGRVESYTAKLEQHVAALEADIRSHLWVTDDFVQPASENLGRTQQHVAMLRGRIEAVRQGFDLLPRESSPLDPAASDGDAESP